MNIDRKIIDRIFFPDLNNVEASTKPHNFRTRVHQLRKIANSFCLLTISTGVSFNVFKPQITSYILNYVNSQFSNLEGIEVPILTEKEYNTDKHGDNRRSFKGKNGEIIYYEILNNDPKKSMPQTVLIVLTGGMNQLPDDFDRIQKFESVLLFRFDPKKTSKEDITNQMRAFQEIIELKYPNCRRSLFFSSLGGSSAGILGSNIKFESIIGVAPIVGESELIKEYTSIPIHFDLLHKDYLNSVLQLAQTKAKIKIILPKGKDGVTGGRSVLYEQFGAERIVEVDGVDHYFRSSDPEVKRTIVKATTFDIKQK
jgi:hypothetical protein